MNKSKRIAILLLVCLNVGLLGALIHVNMQPAQAQIFPTTNYVCVTGKIGTGWDGLYVIDLATHKLACFKWDKTTKRIQGIGRQTRSLRQDFRTTTPR